MSSGNMFKKMNKYLLLFVFFICNGFHHTFGLFLKDLSVPTIIDYQDRAKLSCNYNMGKHALNSIKWYKDDMEFFRYAPMNSPPIVNFTVNGVHLYDETFHCNTHTCTITLEYLEPRTSGAYRCEISGDAPEFKLVSKTANMTVVAMPRTDPEINGFLHSYTNGDFVSVNCTSDKSNPPANLTWYINDEEVPQRELKPYTETSIQTTDFRLISRIQNIQFHIDKDLYTSEIIVKCVANMGYPSLVRERKYKIKIDDVTNQKLVNWKNAASKTQGCCFISLIVIFFCSKELFRNLKIIVFI